MPLIFRTMFADESGRPRIGGKKCNLGVRVAPETPADIQVAQDQTVRPGAGGMSVAPQWRRLPFFLIPRRLKEMVAGATGNNQTFCWKMGDGPFTMAVVADGLQLKPENDHHGLVEPDDQMA